MSWGENSFISNMRQDALSIWSEKNYNQPRFFSDGENNFPVNPERSSDSTYWVAARCDQGIQYHLCST